MRLKRISFYGVIICAALLLILSPLFALTATFPPLWWTAHFGGTLLALAFAVSAHKWRWTGILSAVCSAIPAGLMCLYGVVLLYNLYGEENPMWLSAATPGAVVMMVTACLIFMIVCILHCVLQFAGTPKSTGRTADGTAI